MSVNAPQALPPEKVRWYYSKREFFQIVPEFPNRGDFLRTNEHDSLNLEMEYRKRKDEYDTIWMGDYADEVVSKKAPSGSSPVKAPPAPPPAPSTLGGLDRDKAAFPPEDSSKGGVPRAFPEQAGPIDDIREGRVPILGGLHLADLNTRCTAPLYWKGSRSRLLRGTWFWDRGGGEFGPLRESLASQLEAAYVNEVYSPSRGNLKLQPDGTMAAKVTLTSKSNERLYALFVSDREVYLCVDSTLSKVKRTFGGAPGYRLRRGYEPPLSSSLLSYEADLKQEEEDMMASLTPVRHLVFVVHGIGQKLEAADITKDTNTLRGCLRSLELQMGDPLARPDPSPTPPGPLSRDPSLPFTLGQRDRSSGIDDGGGTAGGGGNSHPPGSAGGDVPVAEVVQVPKRLYKRTSRIEVLPIQWRREILADVDAVSEDIMPKGVRPLRQLLATLTVDLMYYLSPLHCEAIVRSLASQLNAQYRRFILSNPDFVKNGGKVSLLGHSLGSVLCFDMLSNQPRHYTRIIEEINANMAAARAQEQAQAAASQPPSSKGPSIAAATSQEEDRGRKGGPSAAVQSSTSLPRSSSKPSLISGLASKVKGKLSPSPPPPPDRAAGSTAVAAPSEALVSPSAAGDNAARLEKLAQLDRLEKEVARLREQLAFGGEDGGAGAGGTGRVSDGTGGEGTSAAQEKVGEAPTPSSARMSVLQYLWSLRAGASDPDRSPRAAGDEGEDAVVTLQPSAPAPSLVYKNLLRINFTPFPVVLHPIDQGSLASAAVAPHRFITFPQLDFEVVNFFAMGSPVGIFLALRGINPRTGKPLGSVAAVKQHSWAFGGVGDCLPAAQRWFNIYHPFDPVAFRIEPLIDPENAKRRPILVPYYRGGLRIHHQVEEIRIGIDRLATRASTTAQGLVGSVTAGVSSLFSRVVPAASASGGLAGSSPEVKGALAESPMGRDPLAPRDPSVPLDLPALDLATMESAGEGTDASLSDDPKKGSGGMTDEELEAVHFIWRLTEGPELTSGEGDKGQVSPGHRDACGRLDFMLQDDPITPSLLSAADSHFSYWSHKDAVKMMILACRCAE